MSLSEHVNKSFVFVVTLVKKKIVNVGKVLSLPYFQLYTHCRIFNVTSVFVDDYFHMSDNTYAMHILTTTVSRY